MSGIHHTSQSDEVKILRYFQHKRILIADSSVATRTTIINILKSLGARWTQITQVADLNSAQKNIQDTQPEIFIWDPSIQEGGIDLVRELPISSLSIAVSKNASPSSVVEAIEAGVDYYIVKPFTAKLFREHFLHAAFDVSISNPRNDQIESAIGEWKKGNLEKAEAILASATLQKETPLIAKYYLGKVLHELGDLKGAKEQFETGLAISPGHFMCLLGLFDVSRALGEKNFAYDLAKRIFDAYPLSHKRLEDILDLAFEIGRWDDASVLYNNFLKLDVRSAELCEKMVSTLIKAGKRGLERGEKEIGADFIKRAIISSGHSLRTLRRIILLLVEIGQTELASEILSDVAPDQKLDPEVRALAYKIDCATESTEQAFEIGNKLIKDGVLHPDIHHLLAEKAYLLGKTDLADQLEYEAKQRWPAQRQG